MGKKKITITRALTEIKTLDGRIQTQTRDLKVVRLIINGKVVTPSLPKTPKEQIQSIDDMITRRAVLRSAILMSNMRTMVTIGEKVMSVIEAIELKSTIIYQALRAQVLSRELATAQSTIDRTNTLVQTNVDSLLQSASGGTAMDKDSISAISEPYKKLHEMVMDPETEAFKAVADEISASVEKFNEEVDYVLSESNALTTIDV